MTEPLQNPLPKSINSPSYDLPQTVTSLPQGFPNLDDCNLVDLPFEYDWEADDFYQALIRSNDPHNPMFALAIEFSKAVVVEGGNRYIQAFRKFCPDHHRDIARILWHSFGAKELVEYIDRVRLEVGTLNQKPPRTIVHVENFLPGHDFGNDPCYAILVKGVDDRFVEISKAHALGPTLAAAVRQVIPCLANDDVGVDLESKKWRRSERARALHQYLATLVMALAVSEGPKDLKDYNDALEKMFWNTQDVDARLKLHRAITVFKGTSMAPSGVTEMPAEFDPAGLED